MATDPCTGKVVILVEDNDIARLGTAAVLQEKGFVVIPFSNGQKALDHLRAGYRTDLILLDMLMPVVDGWKFIEELRNWSRPVDVPIIVTTSTILTPEWANQNGLAGLLRKPIDAAELVAAVHRLLC